MGHRKLLGSDRGPQLTRVFAVMARSKAAGGLILPAGAKSQAMRESLAASRTARNRHQRVHQDHQTRKVVPLWGTDELKLAPVRTPRS
jgi:hypothetical protein